MDYLKEGIGLRAMAQRDPLIEYQREGFQLFQAMTESIKEESVGFLFNLDVQVQGPDASGAPGAPVISAASAAAAAQSDAGQVVAGAAEPAEAAPVAEPEAPGETEPVAGPAAAAQEDPVLLAKGLDAPAPQRLSYSSPSEDGSTTTTGGATRRSRRELHGEAVAPTSDGRTFPGTPRNAQCPCGSGKKYKVCHGVNE